MKFHRESQRRKSKSQRSKRKSQRSKSQHSKSQRSKSQHSKSQHSKSQRSKHNSYKGGNISLASQPFNSLGFGNGASSPREAALLHEQNSNDQQQQLNKMSGGKRSRGKRSRKQRGGNIEVPSFPPIGGINQAYSATNLSIGGNTNIVDALNQAQWDCHAKDNCETTTGGTKRTKRRKL